MEPLFDSNTFSVELQDLFSYSIIPIIIVVLLILIIMIIYFLLCRKKKVIKEPNKISKVQIKNNYLTQMDELLLDFKNDRVSDREVYIRLSKIIRNFIFEMTNLRLPFCTLEEIRGFGMPKLTNLVEEYYSPEFKRYYDSKPMDSINKTREVIFRWN